MNAIPIDPTSPAKHLALPFGRKLNIQNTIAAIIVVKISDCATYSLSVFKAANGSKTANEYPAVIPFLLIVEPGRQIYGILVLDKPCFLLETFVLGIKDIIH